MTDMTDTQSPEQIRAAVRERYAAAAEGASCCGPDGSGGRALLSDEEQEVFGASQYADDERQSLPQEAQLASLGCGNPTAVAELHEGETVLDLGSGGGIDVLLSAQRVGPRGRAYGLDMTDEMLALARQNAARARARNVRFLKGQIEAIPLPEASVDVIISNCVINLSGDKPSVLKEAARVLRPGGRLAFTDVVADPDMDAATRQDMQQWTGCIAGALTIEDFERQLAAAGLDRIEITETHRIHEHAGSAIIRARKPSADACCGANEQASCCEPVEKADCCGTTTTGDHAPSSCGCR
jgi:arsenite methyltransferase